MTGGIFRALAFGSSVCGCSESTVKNTVPIANFNRLQPTARKQCLVCQRYYSIWITSVRKRGNVKCRNNSHKNAFEHRKGLWECKTPASYSNTTTVKLLGRHAVTLRRHAVTLRRHAVTLRRHAVTLRRHAVTSNRHSFHFNYGIGDNLRKILIL